MPRPQSVAEQPCLKGMPSLPALSTLRRLRQYGAKGHSRLGTAHGSPEGLSLGGSAEPGSRGCPRQGWKLAWRAGRHGSPPPASRTAGGMNSSAGWRQATARQDKAGRRAAIGTVAAKPKR